ncbi:2-hydroxyacid dehydrogenase [Shinella sp. CPCC 100929]|uniref:2-hydroxyacid dehydrogenase n=1 Tax=Shinella lacus TaxID=2654216 RepID=A0ABT1R1F4_9HYPH|nr:2-hydroxyacid dehydrogenase [Shinella lacus]MCQ4628997.1 2-hydroxyacid dehydrogenase [Shinella lacus]
MGDHIVGIIDSFHSKSIDAIASRLPSGWRLSIAEGTSEAARHDALRDVDALYVMASPISAPLLDAAPRLRFIQKLGAGVDRIDVHACLERGIAVARLQAGNAIPVAEHTLLLMLAACRRLPLLDRETRAGGWDKEEARGFGRQIHGKTVGIVGLGAIGQTVVRLLKGFAGDICYYDPRRADASVESALGVRYVSLDALVEQADILSLHLPLTNTTANLFDASRLSAMKPGSILVNCARGGLVDEAALHDALVSGRIFAAGLDAFAKEPPVGSPLLGLDQTVVTPHTAGATLDNFGSVVERAVRNTEGFFAGAELPENDIVLLPPHA